MIDQEKLSRAREAIYSPNSNTYIVRRDGDSLFEFINIFDAQRYHRGLI